MYLNEVVCVLQKAIKYKVASSWDSKEYYQKYRPQSLLDRDIVLEPTQTSSSSSEPMIDTDGKDDKDPGNIMCFLKLQKKLLNPSQ